MELTLDEAERRMVIYVQSSSNHKPHPLSVETLDAKFDHEGQEYDTEFVADPRSDDPDRSSSRFALSIDKLPQQLLASNQFTLQLSFTSGGETSAVSIFHDNDHVHDYHHD